ncbi:MAG TPA: hypothetical protein VFC99_17265 [Acidimicrobiia bacterium]|nr:hypothetical protein [Acidimicrobiia bacterium]
MAKGRLRRLAVIGAAIGGVIFFWRKRKSQDTFGAASSGTIDYGAVSGSGDTSPGSGPGGPTAE